MTEVKTKPPAKTKAAPKHHQEETSTVSERLEGVRDWAQFGLEAGHELRKEWMEANLKTTNLLLNGVKDALSWTESYYNQSQKNAERLLNTNYERLHKALERMSQ